MMVPEADVYSTYIVDVVVPRRGVVAMASPTPPIWCLNTSSMAIFCARCALWSMMLMVACLLPHSQQGELAEQPTIKAHSYC